MDLLTKEEKEYLESGKYQTEYPELETTLSTPRFLMSELGVTARDATYWDKQGILPPIKGVGARRKYDLIQAVWIKLIQQMRSFGLPVSIIKEVKEKLLHSKINLEDILRDPKGKEVLTTIAKAGGYKGKLEELIESGELKEALKGKTVDFFSTLVKSVVIFRKPISILVSKDGDIAPYAMDQHAQLIAKEPALSQALSIPHISLSVVSAYSELVKDWSSKPFFENLSLLSNKEIEALNAVREPGVKSIKINFSKGELDLMEVVKTEKVTAEKRFLEVISKNGYHNINVKTRNGKIVSYENAQMRKVKGTK